MATTTRRRATRWSAWACGGSEAEAALRPLDEALPVEERVRLALSGAVPAGAGG